MKIRSFFLLTILAISLLALAACGGERTNEDPAGENPEAPTIEGAEYLQDMVGEWHSYEYATADRQGRDDAFIASVIISSTYLVDIARESDAGVIDEGGIVPVYQDTEIADGVETPWCFAANTNRQECYFTQDTDGSMLLYIVEEDMSYESYRLQRGDLSQYKDIEEPAAEVMDYSAMPETLAQIMRNADPDSLLLAWVNPPQDILNFAGTPVILGGGGTDTVVLCPVGNATSVAIWSGVPVYNDMGEFDGWDTASVDMEVNLNAGQAVAVQTTVPEGQPAYAISVSQGGDGILWPLAAYDPNGQNWYFIERYSW